MNKSRSRKMDLVAILNHTVLLCADELNRLRPKKSREISFMKAGKILGIPRNVGLATTKQISGFNGSAREALRVLRKRNV